jgi:hypothetical protein
MLLRRPVRQFAEEIHVDHARELFRQQREWLEARFVGSLSRINPAEAQRWDDAHWHDAVLWARDRQTRRLLALIEVHFDPDPFELDPEGERHHATALFEFRKGQWVAEGKRLDEVRPDEALQTNRRFEPVAPYHRRD